VLVHRPQRSFASLSGAKHRDADAFGSDLEDPVSEDKVPQR
jgi:hypothetical protein